MLCDGKPAAYLGDVDITHLRVSNHLQALSEAAERQSCNHRQLLEDRHESHLDFILTTQFTYLQADISTKGHGFRKPDCSPMIRDVFLIESYESSVIINAKKKGLRLIDANPFSF